MITRSHARPIIVLVSVAMLAGPAAGRPATQAPSDLHGRARLHGSRLIEPYPNLSQPPMATILDMFRGSPIVVIGTVVAERSRLAPDGQTVRTDLALRPDCVLRGVVMSGTVIRVAVPGGSYRFPDGVVVHQTTPGFSRPRLGSRHAMFLRPLPVGTRGKAEYELSVGTQGDFELDAHANKVKCASSNPLGSVATRYNDMTVAQFMTELTRARHSGQ